MYNYKQLTDKITFNFIENTLISSLYNSDLLIEDLCVLDVCRNLDISNFYEEYFYSSIITYIYEDIPVSHMNADYIHADLAEQIGGFSKQYDVIIALDTFNVFLDDIKWQKYIKNLLFYLKYSGIIIIGGNFPKNTFRNDLEWCRSKLLWKTLLKQYNCKIIDFIDNSNNIFLKDLSIMVVQK